MAKLILTILVLSVATSFFTSANAAPIALPGWLRQGARIWFTEKAKPGQDHRLSSPGTVVYMGQAPNMGAPMVAMKMQMAMFDASSSKNDFYYFNKGKKVRNDEEKGEGDHGASTACAE